MPGQASVSTIVIPTQLIIFRSPHKLLKTSTNRAVNWTSRNFTMPGERSLDQGSILTKPHLGHDLLGQFHIFYILISALWCCLFHSLAFSETVASWTCLTLSKFLSYPKIFLFSVNVSSFYSVLCYISCFYLFISVLLLLTYGGIGEDKYNYISIIRISTYLHFSIFTTFHKF